MDREGIISDTFQPARVTRHSPVMMAVVFPGRGNAMEISIVREKKTKRTAIMVCYSLVS